LYNKNWSFLFSLSPNLEFSMNTSTKPLPMKFDSAMRRTYWVFAASFAVISLMCALFAWAIYDDPNHGHGMGYAWQCGAALSAFFASVAILALWLL
jgi:hypothetical protein